MMEQELDSWKEERKARDEREIGEEGEEEENGKN